MYAQKYDEEFQVDQQDSVHKDPVYTVKFSVITVEILRCYKF